MFKKPFRVKSQSVMKGSDRKKLRAELGKAFRDLSVDECNNIIPNKEEVIVVKIHTHAGENAFIYCVNKTPILFEIDKQKVLYPSVYLLWRYPELVYRFTTWPPVFKKLTDGADLMLPGVIVRGELTPNTFKGVEKWQICSVSLYGNRAPVAVGSTLMSGSDMFDSGMKGKGIHASHLLGDELWSFGDKSKPPDLGDDPLPEELAEDSDTEDVEADNVEGNGEDPAQNGTESLEGAVGGSEDSVINNLEAFSLEEETTDDIYDALLSTDKTEAGSSDLVDLRGQSEDTDLGTITNSEDTVVTVEEMDAMLEFCFRCAIKSSVKKTDLPLMTSTFYRAHVMKYCPVGKHLDIKKSSYKKLSKFLQKQEKTGIITVKELSKGVDSITEMDKSHLDLRGLEVPEIVAEEPADPADILQYSPPIITELSRINAEVLPLFTHHGYSKGSSLSSSDVRNIVTDYVKVNNLQPQESKSEVILDPLLAQILLHKSEGDRSSLQWNDIFSRLQNKMSSSYEIKFEGQPPIVKKGDIPHIKIDVLQRASNKKVTIIDNLDVYGIDPKLFGHTVQLRVACSASVVPTAEKLKGPQVVVQGNQVRSVGDLLTNEYKIPKKYITGLGKAPKAPKSKKR